MRLRKTAICLILVMALLHGSIAIAAGRSGIENYQQFQSNIPGVTEEMLYPDFWVKHAQHAEKIIMNSGEIEQYNLNNIQVCDPVVDLQNYKESFTKEELKSLLGKVSAVPTSNRYNSKGELLTSEYFDALVSNLNIDGLEEVNPVGYGISVKRTELRTFPTADRVFSSTGSENDMFMETAVYPVEPLVILHTSTDNQWYFAQMYNYLAWIPAEDVALTGKDELFDYLEQHDFLMITGNRTFTSYNTIDAAVSELQLDMGVKLPLARAEEIPDDIDLQNPAGNFVVKLPTRGSDGWAVFRLALISRSEDVCVGYLPYTNENIIRQAFKMQGQRYGWGGTFNARDCTAFMMDIFRTMGVNIPRNSGEQGQLAAGVFYEMNEDMSLEDRKKLMDKIEPGTALYMSGHAMLYLGKYKNDYYMIHDFGGFRVPQPDGTTKYYSTREIAVTPLTILSSSTQTFLERLYGARRFMLEEQ